MAETESSKAVPRKRRRWWQFSLAAMLTVTTILAVVLGLWSDSARRQQQAIQWIEDHGGGCSYRWEVPTKPNDTLTPPGPEWLRERLGIDYLDYVQEAYVGESISDEELAQLVKDLPRLKCLGIKAENITNEGLATLAKGLPQLELLGLQQAERLTDEGLADLARHAPRLLHLQLEDASNITDMGLAHLANLRDITHLHLDCPQITDAGLVHLKELRQISSLGLQSNHISDAGLVHLMGLRQIDSLLLESDRITDAGLVHLRPLTNIDSLTLNCTVTDAGMEHLTGLTKLRRLQCMGAPSDKPRRALASTLRNDWSDVATGDMPLGDVIGYLADYHGITIRLDEKAIASVNVDRMTRTAPDDPPADRLNAVLDALLKPLKLGWYVGEGEIVVTTAQIAAEKHAGLNRLRAAAPSLADVDVSW
jgi:hypothetical protein